MNKTLLFKGCPLLLAAMVCGHARADDGAPSYDDRFYMAPMGSYAMSRSSSAYDDGYGARVAVGKLAAPHLGFELLASYLYRNPKSQDSGGPCGLLNPCPADSGSSGKKEVGSVGAGFNLYLFRSNHGLFAHVEALAGNDYGYAGGLGYDLRLSHQGFGLRLQALYHKDNPDKAEPMFNAGFFIPFGAAHAVPTEPEQPVTVVPVVNPSAVDPAPAPTATPAGGANLDGVLPDANGDAAGSAAPQAPGTNAERH